MKFVSTLAILVLATNPFAWSAEPEKSPFQIKAKPHLMEVDSGRSFGGDSRTKTYTLRVEIFNISRAPVEGCKLSGQVLVNRSTENKEKLVKESIDAVDIPALKPGAKTTIDLGKILVHKVKWMHKDFEESIGEWKVVCTKDNKEIAGFQTSPDFTAQAKEAPSSKPIAPHAPMNRRERPLRRLMERPN